MQNKNSGNIFIQQMHILHLVVRNMLLMVIVIVVVVVVAVVLIVVAVVVVAEILFLKICMAA